jgi:hypothetical protein
MEQFIHQQNIAIFRRLLSTQTDNNEARREKLSKLLAAEEAKAIVSSQYRGRDQGHIDRPYIQRPTNG